MDKINTWKYRNEWHANRVLIDDGIITRYSVNIYGTGKTKAEAINSLCDALMILSEKIKEVVHEVNVAVDNLPPKVNADVD